MIFLAFLLAAQVPPPPSGIALPPGAVEVLDPIAPALGRYEDCVTDAFHAKHPFGIEDPEVHRREMDKAIASCADVRRSAVAEADRALAKAPDYRDPVKRDLAIRHAFEGTEAMHRDFATLRASGVLPGQDRPPEAAVNVPAGSMPVIMNYNDCLTTAINHLLRQKQPDREARQSAAAAAERDCRQRALALMPTLADGRIQRSDAARAMLNQAMDAFEGPLVKAYVDPQSLMPASGDADAPH
jgi:hypothetical protein